MFGRGQWAGAEKGKPWPQVPSPATCFSTACELKNGFYNFKWLEKMRRRLFCDTDNLVKCKFQRAHVERGPQWPSSCRAG